MGEPEGDCACACAAAIAEALRHLEIGLATAAGGLYVDWASVAFKIGVALGGIEVAEGDAGEGDGQPWEREP